MKMLLALVIMAAVAVCVPLRASAESYVVGKAGAGFPRSDLDTGFIGELGLGWDFSPAGSALVALEFTVGYNAFSNNSGLGGIRVSVDTDTYPIGLTLKGGWREGRDTVYYGGIGADIIPVFFDASGSFMGTTISDSDSDAVFGAHLLAGVTYDLTGSIFIGAEAKYLWANNMNVSFAGSNLDLDLNCFSLTGMIGLRF